MNKAILTRKKSKIYRELNTALTVMTREITVLFKSPSMFIMSLTALTVFYQ